ncbi:PaaX family transcriptional regulator [Actinorhabdospora filicis]|uniref:PaaX family transcriptional regulator n=1 Tax=Actinorhabdospora filicis TaxID=1785913 RepID=A0A9W6W5M2_9ACTN|nr:PaaX family transcriptional regulator C-terminal domain-containing protein [Actinorhabdospora filicis]GLZ80542.1 PaaX family transcriptional regulator [Actinorhabdospora filicis]
MATPRSLIVTVYGLYARDSGGALPVAGLIRLMSSLGVDEPAVRSAVSRLKRRGVIEPARVADSAGYALTTWGREVLEEGDGRIFGHPEAGVADGWVLCVFSVPESQRTKRHTLRSKLTWLGFGVAASGVWIAPAHVAGAAAETLRRAGLDGYASLFRSDHLGPADLRTEVARWWDLDALRAMYEEWIAAHETPEASPEPADAFAHWVTAVDAWRRLPYLDPGLPKELLPDDWPATRAVELFERLRERLAEPAALHVARML